MRTHGALKSIFVAGLLILTCAPAFADAIDGDWCSQTDGSSLSINGPDIITPSGSQTTGNYSRHAFTYTIPDGDPGAGGTTEMQLLNDNDVQITAPDTPSEVWHRCGLTA